MAKQKATVFGGGPPSSAQMEGNRQRSIAMPVDTTGATEAEGTAEPPAGEASSSPSRQRGRSASKSPRTSAMERTREEKRHRGRGSAVTLRPGPPLRAQSQPRQWRGGRWKKARKCLCCHSMDHQKYQCPYAQETCTECGVIGHIRSAYRQLNKDQKERSQSKTPVRSPREEEERPEEERRSEERRSEAEDRLESPRFEDRQRTRPCRNCRRGLSRKEIEMDRSVCLECDPPAETAERDYSQTPWRSWRPPPLRSLPRPPPPRGSVGREPRPEEWEEWKRSRSPEIESVARSVGREPRPEVEMRPNRCRTCPYTLTAFLQMWARMPPSKRVDFQAKCCETCRDLTITEECGRERIGRAKEEKREAILEEAPQMVHVQHRCKKCNEKLRSKGVWHPTKDKEKKQYLCQRCVNELVDGWEETDATGPTSMTRAKKETNAAKDELKERVSQIVAMKVYEDLTQE